MNGHLLPSDAGWTDDKVLNADLSHANADITRYILRYFDADADAGRAEPISIDDEHRLGLRLMELGERLRSRAARREAQVGGHGLVLEGNDAQPPALEPSPDMDRES